MTNHETPDRVTAIYEAIDAFQRTHRLPGLQHAQIRALLAEHLARAFPAAVSVPPPAPRADAEAVARVRAVHKPASDWSWKPLGCQHDGEHAAPCRGCRGECWPCPTIRALDGEQQPDDGEGDELVCVDMCGSCDACGMDPFGTPAEGWREAARFLRRTARDSGDRQGALHGARLIEAELRRLADESGPCVAGEQQNETPEADVLRCVCGDPVQLMDENDPASWIHSPGSDTRCLEARPRCPHCQMPHDLTPESLPVATCAGIRHRIAEAERSHTEGDHSLCCRRDCEALRQS